MTIPNQDPKKCNKCGNYKPRTDFYFRSNGWISGYCKKCTKLIRAKYLKDNYKRVRAREKVTNRIKRQRIKDTVFAAYGGYECSCCGESEKMFLTIDHINNDGADHRRKITGRRNSAGYHTYHWIVKNKFPDGFQVLCMNCNHGKRMNKGICPHKVRCNDQSKDVEPSGSKCIAPHLQIVKGEDMISSALKNAAVY